MRVSGIKTGISTIACNAGIGGNVKRFPIGKPVRKKMPIGTVAMLVGRFEGVFACIQSLVRYFKSKNWNFLVVFLEGKQQITPEFEKKFYVLKTSTDLLKNLEPEELKKGDESGRETKGLDLSIPDEAQVLDNAFCHDFGKSCNNSLIQLTPDAKKILEYLSILDPGYFLYY